MDLMRLTRDWSAGPPKYEALPAGMKHLVGEVPNKAIPWYSWHSIAAQTLCMRSVTHLQTNWTVGLLCRTSQKEALVAGQLPKCTSSLQIIELLGYEEEDEARPIGQGRRGSMLLCSSGKSAAAAAWLIRAIRSSTHLLQAYNRAHVRCARCMTVTSASMLCRVAFESA
jgi:hypothetical protein